MRGEYGGIGKRARLWILWAISPCGFEPHYSPLLVLVLFKEIMFVLTLESRFVYSWYTFPSTSELIYQLIQGVEENWETSSLKDFQVFQWKESNGDTHGYITFVWDRAVTPYNLYDSREQDLDYKIEEIDKDLPVPKLEEYLTHKFKGLRAFAKKAIDKGEK